MEERTQRLTHLEQLADVLTGYGFMAELVSKPSKPYLTVTNTATPRLNERVLCQPDDNGAWSFWWPWQQPIGQASELDTVVRKIMAVLHSVEADEADENG
jgi:hypothetical protein